MNTRGILLVALLICGPSYVEAASWKRADVYYLPWELEVRARLSPERVRALASVNPPLRSTYRVYRVSGDRFTHLVQVLDLSRLHKADGRPEDARLVVDFVGDSGRQTTYYASRFDLCTTDNLKKRPIDNAFRDYFRDLHL